MFRIFLIIFILLCLSSGSFSAEKSVKITVLSNNCFLSMKYSDFEYQIYEALADENKDIQIKEFYLDCYGSCDELKIGDRFFNIWKKIELDQPDYLIIYGPILFNSFFNEILKMSKTTKIGIFDIFLTNSIKNRLDFFKNEMDNIFIEEYLMDIPLMINFFKSNAKDFKNFYIIRDSYPEHLIYSSYVTRELKRISFDFRVETFEVRTEQQLKSTLILLQNEPSGVLIPFLDDVRTGRHNFLNINNILKIIDKTNFKHIEISLNHDASNYLALSFAHNLSFINRNYDSSSAIQEFLINFKGGGLQEFIDESYFIVNQDKLREILNGYQLLKHTSDYIQIFR